jgi:hypothetical protein
MAMTANAFCYGRDAAAWCLPSLQVEALKDFMTMLGSDPSRAFYGPGHVFAAQDLGESVKGRRGGGRELAVCPLADLPTVHHGDSRMST